jgi:hypothetical protein
MKACALPIVTVFLALPAIAQPANAPNADVSGTWTISGSVSPTCSFTQASGSLSGACKGPNSEGTLTGTISGQAVKWTYRWVAYGAGNAGSFDFSGTVTGNSIAGTSLINGRSAPFSAKKQAGAAPVQLTANTPPALPPSPPVPAQSGSPSPTPTQQAASAFNASPPRTVFDIDSDGSAIHQQSGLVCPVTLQGWARNSTVLYDKPGFDVSCGYRNSAGSVITIIFARHPASVLNQTFDQAKQAIQNATPGTNLREGTATAPRGFDWLKVGFERQNGEIWSDFFITQLHDWEYQVRITYKPADLDEVNAAFAAISDNVARTAGKKGAACDAADKPQRDGKRIFDAEEIRSYTVSAAAQARAIIAASRSGGNWCAEGATSGTSTIDYWRNVAVDPKAQALDRLLGIDNDTHWVVASDAVATNVSAKNGTPHLIYEVLIERTDDIILVAIFDGRPSPTDLIQIMNASRPIYASVNKSTANITFFNPP